MSSYTEGHAPFSVPGIDQPCQTWYRIHGTLTANSTPLIILHGGPGMGHNYLLSLTDLHTQYSMPVIFYDQLGCGNSTHLRHKRRDAAFWTPSLFVDELANLVAHLGLARYNVFGNSWGGMLGAMFAAQRPAGLHRLVVGDSPASLQTWVREADRLRAGLPEEVQEVLRRCEGVGEGEGGTASQEYEDAVMEFYRRHVCRVDPMPEEVMACFENVKKDDTVYYTMNGPSEFHVIGSLKDLDITDQIHKISVPTLLINGRYDEATDKAVEPFFQLLDKVKWVQFAESSHMPNWEERERFMQVVAGFLEY